MNQTIKSQPCRACIDSFVQHFRFDKKNLYILFSYIVPFKVKWLHFVWIYYKFIFDKSWKSNNACKILPQMYTCQYHFKFIHLTNTLFRWQFFQKLCCTPELEFVNHVQNFSSNKLPINPIWMFQNEDSSRIFISHRASWNGI